MIEEKEEAGVGPAGMAANDRGDDPGDGRDFPDEGAPASPEERLVAVEAELNDTRDRLLRALAETENVRRRFQRERDDAQKYAVSGFAKDLLSAADNLRRAIEAMPETEIPDSRTRIGEPQAAFEPGEQHVGEDREEGDQHRALQHEGQLVGGEPVEDRGAEGQSANRRADRRGADRD